MGGMQPHDTREGNAKLDSINGVQAIVVAVHTTVLS